MLRYTGFRRTAARSLLELVIAVGILGLLLGLMVSVLHRAYHAASRLEQALGRKQPNILIILTDDQGYHDVGFHGVTDIPTPHLDSLARNGVQCSNAYVTCSVCSPSRAGLLTGRYQNRFGHENLPPPGNPNAGLPVQEITLATLLQSAGYQTAALGKWHLGTNSALFHPNLRGFQSFFGFLDAQHDYFNYGGPDPIQDNGQPVQGNQYLTQAITARAVSFIESHVEDPFFLYLAYNSPHAPNQAPQEYLDRFAYIQNPLRRGYAAKLSAMDDGIGQILQTLRQHHLERDTLIFYLTDNGGPLTQLGPNGADNTPLVGEKTQLYEGGIRVPFVVQWKGHLPRGTTYDFPVIALDIFPTALAAAGVEVPKDRVYDGVNLVPYLSGENPDPPHDMLFWRQGGGRDFAARGLQYKVVRHNNGPVQLFDLQSKAGETQDLAAERPRVLARLLRAYQEWNSQMIAPLW
jgi:arylsulfatase A-like enzyme